MSGGAPVWAIISLAAIILWLIHETSKLVELSKEDEDDTWRD